uniref:Uncharacterized protein n=1 Tax=Haptolina ericina TaxID=156174 RepID=A0A7S3ET44_9EUKA
MSMARHLAFLLIFGGVWSLNWQNIKALSARRLPVRLSEVVSSRTVNISPNSAKRASNISPNSAKVGGFGPAAPLSTPDARRRPTGAALAATSAPQMLPDERVCPEVLVRAAPGVESKDEREAGEYDEYPLHAS